MAFWVFPTYTPPCCSPFYTEPKFPKPKKFKSFPFLIMCMHTHKPTYTHTHTTGWSTNICLRLPCRFQLQPFLPYSLSLTCLLDSGQGPFPPRNSCWPLKLSGLFLGFHSISAFDIYASASLSRSNIFLKNRNISNLIWFFSQPTMVIRVEIEQIIFVEQNNFC